MGMDSVEIVMRTEEAFGIEIPNEIAARQWPVAIPWPGVLSSGPKTVRELIWQIAAALPKPDIAAGESWTRPRIQAEIRRIVGEQVGAWDYNLKARFVDDIGIG